MNNISQKQVFSGTNLITTPGTYRIHLMVGNDSILKGSPFEIQGIPLPFIMQPPQAEGFESRNNYVSVSMGTCINIVQRSLPCDLIDSKMFALGLYRISASLKVNDAFSNDLQSKILDRSSYESTTILIFYIFSIYERKYKA